LGLPELRGDVRGADDPNEAVAVVFLVSGDVLPATLKAGVILLRKVGLEPYFAPPVSPS
jgi:hypothetical protein